MSTTVTGSKRHLNINADEFAGDLNGTVNTATTATTQSTSDNSTKVATTAFVKAQGYGTSNLALGTTSTTALAGNTSIPSISGLASTSYVDTAVANVVDSSPAALNTLNELAAALGDDANYATTTATAIGTKLPLAGGIMTGNIKFNDNIKAEWGSGSDLKAWHNGTSSYLFNYGGSLNVGSRNGNVQFLGSNGSGGEVQYFKLDGANQNLAFSKPIVSTTTIQGTTLTGTSLDINGNADIAGNLVIDGGTITIDPDANGSVFIWKESDGTTVAGQLRSYSNRGDIYLYSDGTKKTEISSQSDSFIPKLHIGGTSGASGGVLQTTGDVNIDGNADISGTTALGGVTTITDDAAGALTIRRASNADQQLFLRGGAGSGEGRVAAQYSLELKSGIGGSNSYDVTLSTAAGDNALRIDASDSNKAIFSGEVKAPSLDINGNADISGTTNAAVITSTSLTLTNENPSLNFIDSSGSTYSAQWRFKDNTLQYVWGGGIKAYFTTSGLAIGDQGDSNDARIERTGSSPYGLTFKTSNTSALSLDSSQNATFAGDITLGANHIGRDGHNYIGFETDNLIKFRVNNTTQVKISDGLFAPQNDSDIDLGSNGTRFANVYADTLYGDGSNLTNISATDSSKLPLAGGTMSGAIAMGDNDVTGLDELIFSNGTKLGDDGADNYLKLTYGDSGAGGILVYDGDGSRQGYLYGDGGVNASFGLLDGTGSWAVRCYENEYVELRYDDSIKLKTSTSGITVTGAVAATTFSGDLNGTINTATTAVTQSAGNNSTKVATTAYADAAVAALIDNAPANLNTLNELAEALNDDDDAIVTINTALGTKLPLAGGTMTGDLTTTKIHLGNVDLYPSGDNNHLHFTGTAMIGASTTASNNPRIGTSTYPFHQMHADSFHGTTITASGEVEGGSLDINGDADIAGNITSVVALTADQINLKDAGDYLTFYGDDGAQHSIASRQLQGGVGDDLRFNTYGSYIINLDSNNNQSSAANSSFYITKHGGADGNASGNVLFDIDGENGDATFTGNLDGVATLTATTLDINGNADISGDLTGVDTLTAQDFVGTGSYHEFGNATGSVSNNGGWHGRLNVAGTSHARLDVKSVSDSIITTMFAHTGQGAGKLGTYSNHPVHLVVNGTSRATLDSSANFAVAGELEGGSLDINGNADISGALTLGTALAVAEGGTGATANTTWLNSNSFANFASSSADWDTLTTRGLYRFTGATNSPFGGSHATGFTLTEGSGDYGFQLASKGSANNQKYLAYRYRGTSWDDWQYLVTETYGDGRYLKLAGGTMTGALTLSGAPSSNLHAATKAYVDGAVIANTDTQDLSISGQVISLTNGGSVTIPTQTSITGNAASVTNGAYINANQTFSGTNTFNSPLITDIKIKDTRSSGDVTPANFPATSASFSFTDDFGGLGSWYSGITMKGWDGNYAAWQLISEADSSAGDNNLYFRTGAASTWNTIRTVAMLDGTQTFTGAKTFTGTVALTGTGRITGIDTVSASTDAASKAYVDGAVIANTDTQDLSISGRVISLTNGGSVTVPETTIPTIPSGNQIIDWTTDQGSTNIHAGNYTDTNTQLTLNNTNTSTSTTEAATANAARVAYNRGSSGITAANSAQTTANAALPKAGGTMSGNIAMGNQNMTGVNEIEFDDGFKLFGGGNNNYLKAKAANNTNGGIIFQDGDSETMGYLYWDGSSTANFGLLDGTGSWAVRCRENEHVALYYDNATKLQTKSDGVDITGELQCDTLDVDGNSDISGDLTLSGVMDILMVDNSGAAVEFKQGSDLYMRFITTNGGEHIEVNQLMEFGAGINIGGHIISNTLIAGDTFVDDDNRWMTAASINDRFAQINANTTGSSGSCTGNAATATNVAYSGLTGTVPTWNQNTTGSSGSCTGNASTATAAGTVTVTANSQDGSFYPTFVDGTSGYEDLKVDTGWSFNPSSNTMSVDRVTTATSTIRENNSNRAEGGVTGLPLMSLNGQGAGNAANISLHLAGDSTSSNVVKMRMTAVNGDDDLVGAGHLSYLATSDTFGIGQSTSHNQMAILIDNSDVVSMKNQTTFTNGIDVTSAVQSTSKTTGTVKIAGGLGVVKTLNVGEDVVAYASSDERYKDNLKPITNPIDKVKSLTGYTFTWNDKHEQFNGNDDIGVVAQEVEKVLPEIVDTRDNGYKAVKYEKMVALLIEAVKEQQTQIDGLKTIIDGYSK